LLNKIKAILSNEKGTTLIESGLWIALVVLTVAVAGSDLADTVTNKFEGIISAVESVQPPTPGV
jgi:Flp pilus assembly pilin Flp